MSRLSELIAELCPDGVEYKALGEVCYYPRKRVNVDDLDTGSYVSVENLAQNFAGLTNDIATTKSGFAAVEFKRGDVLVGNIRPYLKKVWLADINGGTNGDVLVFRISDGWRNRVLSEFLYMQLASDAFINFDMKYAKGAKMPRGDKKAVLRYRIPIPPIEVQREVVRILDEYTAAHDELMKKLYLEIEYLGIQWSQFLHSKVVETTEGSRRRPLGKLFDVRSPKRIRAREQVPKGIPFYKLADIGALVAETDARPTSCITSEKFDELNADGYVPTANDVLITARGTLGKCYLISPDDKFYFQDGMITWLHRNHESPNSEYLACLFDDISFREYVLSFSSGTAIKYLSNRGLSQVLIPVPSEAEQLELVRLVKRLRAPCQNLAECVRMEIKMREKQLSFLRNHLLSFPEKVS